MKLYCVFFLLVLSLCAVHAQVMQECSAEHTDCPCKDITYSICHNPPASQELHVGSLAECIQNCDLFGSFDQCDYLLYWETGPDENCKIISGPGSAKEEMDKYLNACGVIGQPLTNDGTDTGTCIEGPNDECSKAPSCNGACQDCTADSCNGYRRSECQMLDNPGESSDLPPEYETCLSFCTLNMKDNPWSYVGYDKEQEECICYEKPDHTCQVQVVIQGMNIDQANACHVTI